MDEKSEGVKECCLNNFANQVKKHELGSSRSMPLSFFEYYALSGLFYLAFFGRASPYLMILQPFGPKLIKKYK
jgi:hypothetical protein